MTAPEQNPTSGPAVARWLGVTDSATELEYVELVTAAVNSFVRQFHPVPADGTEYPDHVVQGATMLAARLVRRRNSPAGVEAFTEMGPTYVSRFDPDVDRLLGMGPYRPLVVG